MNINLLFMIIFPSNLFFCISFHSLLLLKNKNLIQLTSKSFNSHKMTSNKVDVAVDLESPEFSSPESVTAKASPFYCYIVSSGNKTYAGYTNNLTRRLRQHNRELVGGARYTSTADNWTYLSIMTSAQWNKTRALQVEYLHKYPTRKKPRPTKYSRPAGRIRSLIEICSRINEPIQLHIDDLFLTTARSDLLAFSHVQVLPLHVSDIIISAPTVVDLTIDLTNE